MGFDDTKSDLTIALTQGDLGKIPPELRVATGHDDEVMLFLVRVGDPEATNQVLMDIITLAEGKAIVEAFRTMRGLIRKRFDIEEAWRVKESLESFGTEVEFVRPSDPA